MVGVLSAGFYWWRKHMSLWQTLDAITPLLAVLAIGLGVAHLATGSAYGAPARAPWAVYLWDDYRHPSQVYEIVAATIVFGLVWRVRAYSPFPGFAFLLWLTASAAARLLLEGYRGDSDIRAGWAAGSTVGCAGGAAPRTLVDGKVGATRRHSFSSGRAWLLARRPAVGRGSCGSGDSVKLNRLEFFLMNNRGRAWSQRALETPLMIGPPGALRGLRVLEVGCGRGVGMEILLERLEAAEVVGFDIDPEMVALAKERTARFGRPRACVCRRCRAHRCAGRQLRRGRRLRHPAPRAGLAAGFSEIARVLKPGGVFYFEDILKGFTGAPLMLTLFDHPQVTQFSGPEFRGALAAAGLQLEDSWRKLGGVGLLGRARRIDQAGAPATERGASALPMPVHTWFGVNAVVQRAGGQDCDILVEGRRFRHPSLVSRFLRHDLPRRSGCVLAPGTKQDICRLCRSWHSTGWRSSPG